MTDYWIILGRNRPETDKNRFKNAEKRFTFAVQSSVISEPSNRVLSPRTLTVESTSSCGP